MNRYDPSQEPSLVDSLQYARMVDQSAPAIGHWSSRILIPYLARPIYYLCPRHKPSWFPVFFALLCVNAFFVATAALFLFEIGQMLLLKPTTSLIAALLYLLNFGIVNFQLAGLVDSGETFFLILVTWFLLQDRWYMLPVLGILGALAKESFVPIATAFTVGWWLVDYHSRPNYISKIKWIILMCVLGLTTVSSVRWIIGAGSTLLSTLVTEWKMQSFKILLDRSFFYWFAWLLPLGLLRLHDFPTSWIVASIFGLVTIVLLSVWAAAPGINMWRYVFNLTGGLLSLSAAVFLENMLLSGDSKNRDKWLE
ncbi:MAG: hypothetical protein U1F76_05550 [Candidatus Competibacteraceae bacterium]